MKFSKDFKLLGKVKTLALLLFLASCQEQAFFEKEGLSEVINPEDSIVLPDPSLEDGKDIADELEDSNDSSEDVEEEVVVTPAPVPTNPTPGDGSGSENEGEESSEDETADNGSNDGNTGSETGGEDSSGDETADNGSNDGNTGSDNGGEDSSEDETADNGNTGNEGDNNGDDQNDDDVVGDVGDFLETCEDINDLTTCEEEQPVEPDPSYLAFSEVFHQNNAEKRKVDILWVVDNSGSMRDEQEALAYNFETFIHNFITKDVDFRMAITTTDARNGHKGKVVGSPKQLNSEEAKKNEHVFINHFKKKIMVGTRGSGREKGLETSDALLHSDHVRAENFLRKDAYLAIVYVSDEEDQSNGAVKDYVNKFKALKENEGLVKIYSIVNMTKDIEKMNSRFSSGYYARWRKSYADSMQGRRYEEAAQLTDGKTNSINDDFHGILDEMGETIVNLSMSFPLAKKSVDGQFEVFVNGVKSESFMHDESSNSIKFDEENTPAEGAEILVKYTVEKENEVNLADTNNATTN